MLITSGSPWADGCGVVGVSCHVHSGPCHAGARAASQARFAHLLEHQRVLQHYTRTAINLPSDALANGPTHRLQKHWLAS